ncbi:thermonuclease family protein [Virgibacillus pantothenticus]|uniref:thermonuclease family protein n=1 Tax=Virgibacillus pantothenticus TaxID=1473 RepID=UPI0025B05F6D|nr:thermonuclease family protein [Virgibacillus pantothenticus]
MLGLFIFTDTEELLKEITDSLFAQKLQANEVIVERVVDGDTLVIKNASGEEERVRLLLVDTPESVHPNKPVQLFAKEASSFAKEKLEGEKVKLELGNPETDKYDRLLGYVWIDDVNFNQLLIEEGYARVAYIYEPNTKYLDEFQDAQVEAKEDKVKIWSINGYVTENGFDMSVAE